MAGVYTLSEARRVSTNPGRGQSAIEEDGGRAGERSDKGRKRERFAGPWVCLTLLAAM